MNIVVKKDFRKQGIGKMLLEKIISETKKIGKQKIYFIRHPEAYPQDALLAIQPDLMETVIDNPSECNYCDFYNLNLLVERDSQGNMVPNRGAIAQLARRYY